MTISVQSEIDDVIINASTIIQQQMLNFSLNPKNQNPKNQKYLNDYLKLQHIYYKIAEEFIKFYDFDCYLPLYNLILYFTDLKDQPQFIKEFVIQKIQDYIILYSNYDNRLEYNHIWRRLCYDFNVQYEFHMELLPEKQLKMVNLNNQQKNLVNSFIFVNN